MINKKTLEGSADGQPEKSARHRLGVVRGGHERRRPGSGGEALSLRLRSAEDDRIWNPRRYLFRKAQGLEQGHDADRPVSRRAARAGATGTATGQIRRRRILHFIFGECRDAVAAGRSDVDALPVPLGSASHQGNGGSRSVRGGQGDDRGDRAGRPRHRARHARSSQHVFQARDQEPRRAEGTQGAGAGDADRRHHVSGLWRADRAHAVRQRLHLAADRRGRRRGKRRQRLPRQQALRSSSCAFDD